MGRMSGTLSMGTLTIALLTKLCIIASQGFSQESDSLSQAPTAPGVERLEDAVRVLPFRLTKWNAISVPAVVNERIALNLMFHTAVDSVSLTKATTDQFSEILFDQQTKVGGWGGESESRFGSSNSVSIGGLAPRKMTIFEDLRSGHETNGKFGPEQLRSAILKLDFEKQQIELHDKLPAEISQLDAPWQKLKLHVDRGLMFVVAEVSDGDSKATNRFLLHSGYSGFALLDDEFVANNEFLTNLPIVQQDELTDSGGNQITTRRVNLPQLSVGQIAFENVPVAFFEGVIGRQRISLLGGDFLKRFQLVFDMKGLQVFLRKNSKFEADYFVKSK